MWAIKGVHPATYKLLSIGNVSKRWREAEKLQGLLKAPDPSAGSSELLVWNKEMWKSVD